MATAAARPSTGDRGYGTEHRAVRARWAPAVASGQAYCAEVICLENSRWMNPLEPWDLAHDRSTGLWRGPSHRRCNRAEAARFVNRKRRSRWATSRRW